MIAETATEAMADQGTRILRIIRKNNRFGVPNFVLSRISLKYSSRIAELRKDGHNIYAERVRLNGRATNVWNYYLHEN